MADITITPGNSFTPTEAVTSTKLNDLGSPTAALTAASIGTADIADDSITPALIAGNAVTTPAILDANVTFAKLTDVIDDDTMATATDTTLATSESIKAYADSRTSDTARVYNSLTHSTVSENIQQNTTGRPLWVSFTLFSNDNISEFRAKISSSSDMSSSTQIGRSQVASDSTLDSAAQLTMIVPDQWYWQFTHVSTSEEEMVHSSFIL